MSRAAWNNLNSNKLDRLKTDQSISRTLGDAGDEIYTYQRWHTAAQQLVGADVGRVLRRRDWGRVLGMRERRRQGGASPKQKSELGAGIGGASGGGSGDGRDPSGAVLVGGDGRCWVRW